jgi:hypothetical protein
MCRFGVFEGRLIGPLTQQFAHEISVCCHEALPRAPPPPSGRERGLEHEPPILEGGDERRSLTQPECPTHLRRDDHAAVCPDTDLCM